MAQLKDILELEKKRIADGPMATIYLFPEGSFYRAYEWSAWLCCRYVSQFKTTRRDRNTELTDDGTVVFVGFPITSLAKYMPEEAEVITNDDKSVVVNLLFDVFSEADSPESITEGFRNWKSAVPLIQSKKSSLKEDLKNGIEMPPHRLSEVMLKVLAFPVEQKTPMECMNFITEIKQDIAKLL